MQLVGADIDDDVWSVDLVEASRIRCAVHQSRCLVSEQINDFVTAFSKLRVHPELQQQRRLRI